MVDSHNKLNNIYIFQRSEAGTTPRSINGDVVRNTAFGVKFVLSFTVLAWGSILALLWRVG